MGEKRLIPCARRFRETLLSRLALRTKSVFSVLRKESRDKKNTQIEKWRASCEKLPVVENEKYECQYSDWDEDKKSIHEKDYFSVIPPPVIPRRSSSWKYKTSCYICKPKYKNSSVVQLPPPPYTEASHPPFEPRYLPISRTQPPKPPLRSSSLPLYTQLHHFALRCSPSAPLNHINFPQKDGATFQWLTLAHPDGNGPSRFRDPIWDLILKVSHVEPSVRHIILAIATQSHQSRRAIKPWDSLSVQEQLYIAQHYRTAMLHLQTNHIRNNLEPTKQALNITLIATYLLTVLHHALHNTNGAHFWQRAGYRILKFAMRVCKPDMHSSSLPGLMRDVAEAFGRLDLRDPAMIA